MIPRLRLVFPPIGLAIAIGFASPTFGQATATKGSATTKTTTTTVAPMAEKVDLNSAPLAKLETLPGITPTIAREIVRSRPHKAVDDLKPLKGITPAILAGLAGKVTVGPVAPATATSPATPAMTKAEEAKERREATKGAASPGPARPIDINAATAEELQEIPGIGPARAAAIIKARPFARVEDLREVPGISPALFASASPHLRLGTPTATATRPAAVPTPRVMTPPATATTKPAPVEVAREDDPAHQSRKKAALPAGKRINLNTATAEELETLPGIGPTRAAAIAKTRPFKTPEDVMKVDGIKEGIYGLIKDHIKVD